MAKHKFPSISLTVRDRAISLKCSTHRGSKECTLCNFPKIFPSPKMAAILNFRIFAKNCKTQICFYLLTVRDRAISSKFSTHRVSTEYNLYNFPKIFPSPKMAAILNFRIFAKNGKTQICFYLLTVRDRAISSKFSTHRVSTEYNLYNFQKIFLYPKMAAILNFRNLCQKWQNTNLLLSP